MLFARHCYFAYLSPVRMSTQTEQHTVRAKNGSAKLAGQVFAICMYEFYEFWMMGNGGGILKILLLLNGELESII